MKRKLFSLMAIALCVGVLATSCKKDDEEEKIPASFNELTVAADNSTATVLFSEAVYTNSDKTGALTAEDFTVTISGGTATLEGFTVVATAGTPEAVIKLLSTGVADGTEVLSITPKADAIYNADGVACEAIEKTATLKEIGLIGSWLSEGTNVSPLLIYAGITKITAEFNADGTYTVESYTADGSKTTMTGNYTQTKSDYAGIWEIRIDQITPSALVSEGIFNVSLIEGVVSLTYEVAQTDPEVVGVTAPTAEGGFGSTSAGAYGMMNVQIFVQE